MLPPPHHKKVVPPLPSIAEESASRWSLLQSPKYSALHPSLPMVAGELGEFPPFCRCSWEGRKCADNIGDTNNEDEQGGRHCHGSPLLPTGASQGSCTTPHGRPHSLVVGQSANTMAKMFSPDPFPLSGDTFEQAVQTLRGPARDNYNALYHFHLLSKPKCWEDKLQAAQKRLFFPVYKPETWYESGAAGEFISAVQAVPVVGLLLVRRLNVLKYVAISSYNGRVAVFSILALEKVADWQERVELLPPEVRTWLEDPDVVVLTSGEGRTFLHEKKVHGIAVFGQLDTERLYQIYQNNGVIRPAVPAQRGDLAWQLAYAVGYHHLPSRRSTWLQLIGTVAFKVEKRDWPVWRMPGWQPDGVNRLNEREAFFLYFSAYGMHMFVSRLLRHGLVYGGINTIVKESSLRDLFLTFLLGAVRGEVTVENPLGLQDAGPDLPLTDRRDQNSPAVRMYNPKFAHLPPLKKRRGELREVPKPPSRTVTIVPPLTFPHPPVQEPGEGQQQQGDAPAPSKGEQVALEEEETRLEPPPNSITEALDPSSAQSDLEEGEIEEEGGEQEGEEELVIFLDEEGKELFGEDALDDNNNNPGASSNKDAAREKRKEGKIQAALMRLATPKKEGEEEAVASTSNATSKSVCAAPSTSNGPHRSLASRLGPIPAPVLPESAPGPGYFTTKGSQQQEDPMEGTSGAFSLPAANKKPDGGETLSHFAPFDYRSRKMPERASAAAFKEEASSPLPVPVAVIAPDRNLVLAARTKRGPKWQGKGDGRKRDRRRSRALSRRLLDHPTLTMEELLNNPYVDHPVFDKRCNFCASWHCSRFLRGTREPNCQKFKEQRELAPSRRLCDYRRCLLPNDHHTAVCPALHSRCSVCRCRGHCATDGCNLADDRIMSKLRYDFEECADVGIYTQKRFQNLAWGFYPYPPSAPRDTAVVSYRRLSDLPIDCAFSTLRSVLQLPENQPLPQGGLLQGGMYLAHHAHHAPEGGVRDPGRLSWEEEGSSADDADY